MNPNLIQSALFAATLLLSSSYALAAEPKPATAGEAKVGSAPKPAEKGAKAAKPAAEVKPVDINSASKAQLKKLPEITDEEADKIIAGRPYLTKANLVTRNIIPAGKYENLKKLVIAKQKPEVKANSGK